MKLILLTPPDFFVEEDKILTALFEEGLDLLHLRKPDTEPVYSERLLTLLPESHHNQIVVHDHFYLKEEFNLRGIHLNGRNPEPPVGYKGHISKSFHHIDELKAEKKNFNYVFLSPIFDSISKSNYTSAFDMEVLKQASRPRYHRQESNGIRRNHDGKHGSGKGFRIRGSCSIRRFVESFQYPFYTGLQRINQPFP